MHRRWKITATVLTLLLIALTIYWLWVPAAQRQVDELKQQAAAIDRSKPPAERFQAFNDIRKKVSELPAKYQQQFREASGNLFRQEMERRIDTYFDLPANQRKAEMDKRIAEMEQFRKMFEQRRNANGNAGGPPNGPPRGGPPAGGPPPGGPPGGGGLSGILDNTQPQFRAKMGAFMRDMNKRRSELGMPPMGPPGRR